MIEIILFTFISNVFFYSYGNLIKFENFSNKIKNINDRSIIGCIFISFLALSINFFLPLTPLINSFFLITGVCIFFVLRFNQFTKKEFIYLLFSSLIASSLIIYSNINRPDAGLYHLPYINILNEYKIIFGLNNIHFRFGTTSIIQYLSAINNNLLFKDLGILIPLSSLASFFIIYFFNNVLVLFKKKKITLENIFSIFIIIFITYKINRYSSYGNDAIAHLSFFYLISKILSNNKPNLQLISLLSVFTFLNKSMMIIALLIPIIFFLNNFDKKNLKIFYSLSSFLIFLWFLKNIIISGCAIYPIKYTCLEKLNWTDIKEIKKQSISGEAWSKDWPNRVDKTISMEKYTSNFNWVHSWLNNHGIIFAKIIFPYLFLILILNLFLLKKGTQQYFLIEKNKNFKVLISISVLGTLLFLLKFPLYRYGYSYIITATILIIINKSQEYDFKRLILSSKFIFFICVIFFSGKQVLKYSTNYNSKFVWPRIYSFETNKKIKTEKIIFDENFAIYFSKTVCMYNNSPCTNYKLKNNIFVEKRLGYNFINLNK